MRRWHIRPVVRAGLVGLCLWLPLPATASSLIPSDAPEQQPLLAAVDTLHAGDPAAAHALLSRYMQAVPDDPLGPLLRLKVSWWGILEGRDVEGQLRQRLEADFEAVQQICDRRLDDDRHDVRALYALGEAWCAMGRLEGLRGHAWSTLRHHQKGTPYLEKALELQPELREPLVSLGVFHYYASRAPGFLRFVARVFRVKADRPRGLQYLRTAAASPGLQQAEAAFFLLELLSNVEDEYFEALPLALAWHQRFPDNLGFRIPLSTTLVAWGRPDVAHRMLQRGAERWDQHDSLTARFIEARLLGMTGRAAEAATLLESYSQADLQSVTWLAAWHPYYLGAAYDQLGRSEDAKAAYRRTVEAPKVADSHGFAERAADRRRGRLDPAVAVAQAAWSWRESMDGAATQLRLALQDPQGSEKDKRLEAHYLLGCLELERGAYPAATQALRAAVSLDVDDEAWLRSRPRTRLLQALLWAGRFEEAQKQARMFEERIGEWGSNAHLGLLVGTALHPEAHTPSFEQDLGAGSDRLQTFALRDVGFTSVVLVRTDGRRQRRHAMRLEGGEWRVQLSLVPGDHLYRFELDGSVEVPDPSCFEVQEHQEDTWSRLRVHPVES